MDKVGFIGYGHMGSVMLDGLLKAEALLPDQVVVSTRTRDKLDGLKAAYPTVEIAENNRAVAGQCATLFLCVPTYQVKPVLVEIGDALRADTHLITIAGGLELASVERFFAGPNSKVMPTLVMAAGAGVTLVCHNSKVSPAEKERLYRWFSHVGQVKVIPEHQFEVASDFTSCAPGLLASICEQFVQAGIRRSDLTVAEASEMLLHTVYGTAKLLLESGEDFGGLIRRVATKGGATEGGVEVLAACLPDVFEKMFAATLERHEARKQVTRRQFGEQG
jgi:pyrroline-5-carboxylate reductase